jgi:hypothetical protein
MYAGCTIDMSWLNAIEQKVFQEGDAWLSYRENKGSKSQVMYFDYCCILKHDSLVVFGPFG